MRALLVCLALTVGAARAEDSALSTLRRMAGDDGAPLAVPVRRAPPTPALKNYKGIVHCHSRLSRDSRGTFEELAAAAHRTGVRFIAMTDHPGGGAPEGQPEGMFDGVLFLRGLEVDHFLAINIQHSIPDDQGAAPTLRQILDQGGLAIVAHPEGFSDWDMPGITGTEIYNLHADLLDENFPWAAAKVLWTFGTDPVRTLTSILDFPGPAFPHWMEQAAKRPFTAVAADDAHHNFQFAGKQIDPYDLPFRFVNTYIVAADLSVGSVVEALTKGRAYVAFSVFGDADDFHFFATDGETSETMGGTLRTRGRAELTVDAPADGEVRLFAGNERIRADEVSSASRLHYAVDPGVYRVEIWRPVEGRLRPWIISNAITVRR